MRILTSQELEQQRKIARKASWLNDLFFEYNFTIKDKVEVLLKIAQKIKKEEKEKEKHSHG